MEKEVWTDSSIDSSETSVYNGFNQLVSVSNDDVDASYTYAPSGLRLTKTVDGDQIYFINDGDNVIAELYDDEVTAYYLRGLNLYGSFIGNDEYFYLYNAHGDVMNLTDELGYVERTYRYDAFGNEREPDSSDNNPFRYCGEYYDGETGSYYLRARYYDPVIGRFTQQDSLRFSKKQLPNSAEIINQLSLNLYTYCYNDPVYFADSSGNLAVETLGGYSAAKNIEELFYAVVSAPAISEMADYFAEAEQVKKWTNQKIAEGGIGEHNLHGHSVYVIADNSTQDVVYVGRTMNYAARHYKHQDSTSALYPSKYYTMMPVRTGMTKNEAQVLEQMLISAYTIESAGRIVGGEINNKINSIAFAKRILFTPEYARMLSLISGLFDGDQ